MLYLVLIYLIIFFLFAYTFIKNIMSPTIVTLITFIFGTIAACIGNINWKIDIPLEVLIVYMIGTFCMFLGEVGTSRSKTISFKKSLWKMDASSVSCVHIPFFHMVIVFLYCIAVSFLVSKRYVAVAINYGYAGLEWQSFSRYLKEALMYGGAHLGMGLASLNAIAVVFAYLGVFLFSFNFTKIGVKKTIIKYWYYLLPLIPWIYINYMKGQRSGFMGILAFAIYTYFLAKQKYTHHKHKIKDVIKMGLLSITAVYAMFYFVGVMSGRSNSETMIESFLVYTGSGIVDFAEYINRGAAWSGGIGVSSFQGLRSTLERFGLFLSASNFDPTGGFVRFANGSQSNVYGPYMSYFADFWYFGVIIIPFVLGKVYKIMYNNAIKNRTNLWAIYLFAYFSYGIVLAFTSEQQTTIFGSVGQIMHLFAAYFIINYVLKRYSVRGNKT